MLRLGGVAIASVLLLVACESSNEGYQPAQPINYSHAVHAGDLQVQCQYCHYAAERGRFAGIPPWHEEDPADLAEID